MHNSLVVLKVVDVKSLLISNTETLSQSVAAKAIKATYQETLIERPIAKLIIIMSLLRSLLTLVKMPLVLSKITN